MSQLDGKKSSRQGELELLRAKNLKERLAWGRCYDDMEI